MPTRRTKSTPVSTVPTAPSDWEKEIAAFDAECAAHEQEFLAHHRTFSSDAGSDKLTEDENEVFTLVLKGLTCQEIADQNQLDVSMVTGLLEIIRAKLAIEE